MTHAQLQELFLAFREQCIWLRCCYNTYSALYESENGSDNVLRESAAVFFEDLNTILIEYCFLQLCKITDPAETNGRKNLTVDHINATLLDTNLMTEEIDGFSCGLLHYRELVKNARNKLISHLDREAVLNGFPIGEHAAGDVDAFFGNLFGYVNAVGDAVGVGPLDFRTTAGRGDVHDLLRTLENDLAHAPPNR